MNAPQLTSCLAKTYGEKQAGRHVLNHCQIVGEVAKELIARMPEWLHFFFLYTGVAEFRRMTRYSQLPSSFSCIGQPVCQ